MPVFVVEADNLEGDAIHIERVLAQHAENHHRAALRNGDEVEIHRRLAAFGMTATQIAKWTRTRETHVEAALSVAGSSLRNELMDQQLTLEQAAIVTEFEDDEDDEDACNALVEAANEGRFDHVAQRLRDDREEAQAIKPEVQRLTKAGVAVLIEQPGYDSPTVALSRLADANGEKIIENAHTECPGHAVYLFANRPWLDGRRGELEINAYPVCTDPKGSGHVDTWTRSHGSDKKAAGTE